jgi:hypothetical protein
MLDTLSIWKCGECAHFPEVLRNNRLFSDLRLASAATARIAFDRPDT